MFDAYGGPLLWPSKSAVPEFADAKRLVSGIFELHNEGFLRLDSADERIPVVVDAGSAWPFATEQRRSRRIANGPSAMCVGERHSHCGESIDVRRLGLLVASEMTNPMIQVVDGDKQNVWLCF